MAGRRRREAARSGRRCEVTGTFIDVGRLTQDDPRRRRLRAARQKVLQREWPAQGELPGDRRQRGRGRADGRAVGRGLALDPGRFDGQAVTVVAVSAAGTSSAISRQPPAAATSTSSSSWPTRRLGRGAAAEGPGLRPERRRRVDTGRWLEVAGVVKRSGAGLDRGDRHPHDARRRTAPPRRWSGAGASRRRRSSSRADAGRGGRQPDAGVRLQFSRDMTPQSFKGNVMASPMPACAAPPPAFTVHYDQGGERWS